jgi:hypothetical protein
MENEQLSGANIAASKDSGGLLDEMAGRRLRSTTAISSTTTESGAAVEFDNAGWL